MCDLDMSTQLNLKMRRELDAEVAKEDGDGKR
jgi:hypothetical protein